MIAKGGGQLSECTVLVVFLDVMKDLEGAGHLSGGNLNKLVVLVLLV